MLLWFTDLMNVTEEVTIDRPNISTVLSSAFIRGGLKFLFCVCVNVNDIPLTMCALSHK